MIKFLSLFNLISFTFYQKFRIEDGRIICFEGQKPMRLYHVVSGRLDLVRKYDIKSGAVYKLLDCLNKDQFTDVCEKKSYSTFTLELYYHLFIWYLSRLSWRQTSQESTQCMQKVSRRFSCSMQTICQFCATITIIFRKISSRP